MSPRTRSAPALDLDALAEALAPQVARLVLARLATALGAAEGPYSTRRGHEPPEFTARPKKWRAVAPGIAGAVKLGRWWSVPRAAYAAWVAAQSPRASTSTDEPWTPVRDLAALGLRRGGR